MDNCLTLKIENGFAIIEFDQPDSKVNVLSAANLTELEKLIQELNEKKDLSGLCIVSNKPDIFIAGADIKEIEGITTPLEAGSKARKGQEILNALEKLPFPTAALINGACLGGGLELALACDYRLASFSDKVKLGLPEVKLGIIPGFGGTKRLPRLVGLRKGLELILSGEAVSAEAALKIGLVDALVSESRLLEEGRELLRQKSGKRKQFPPKTKGFLNLFLERTLAGRAILKSQARSFVLHTTKGHYPAPLKALEVVVKNYSSSLKAALEREARAFSELATGLICKKLISVFYLIEKYKKAKYGLEAKPRQMHKCGVLGAGVMGGGIAQLFSNYGLAVRMKDLNYSALGRGLKEAREVYDYAIKKKKLKPHQAEFGMGLISVTCDYSGFSNADLIVEAVVEEMQIKQAVLAEVSAIAQPAAILASNTSCLSITRMAQEVMGKERVVGMHFFNPVHRMPLVEIIRTSQTSDETIATILEFSRKLGKIPIVVKDSCGFLVNRILLPYLNEAGLLLEEGVSFEKIDTIMLKFGMPMGPFTLIDEIGLDVGYKVALILEEDFGLKMQVSSALKNVYAQKWFGKKTGKGFYIHQGKRKIPNKGVYDLFTARRAPRMSDEYVLQRMAYRMVNEAAFCLEEGVSSSPQDVDIGMIMGAGFPAFRGGLLYYADSVGLDKIVEDLKKFQDETASVRFAPCNYLLNLAKGKGKFYK